MPSIQAEITHICHPSWCSGVQDVPRHHVRCVDRCCRSPGEAMLNLSRLIGKTDGYLAWYISDGVPMALPANDRDLLASYLGVQPTAIGCASGRAIVVGCSTGAQVVDYRRNFMTFSKIWNFRIFLRIARFSPRLARALFVALETHAKSLSGGAEICGRALPFSRCPWHQKDAAGRVRARSGAI